MSTYSTPLSENLADYLYSIAVEETETQKALRAETQKLKQAQMQISVFQGQFMQWLVQLINAKKIIEIGVFTGYSSLTMALAMPKDGKIIACDINEEWTEIAKQFWQQANVAEKIELHLQPAIQTLTELLSSDNQNTFDLAFIDADKANYLHYYEAVLPLIRPNGLILFDNVFLSGRVIDPNANDAGVITMRKLNQLLHQDKRVNITTLPIADGLTLARKI